MSRLPRLFGADTVSRHTQLPSKDAKRQLDGASSESFRRWRTWANSSASCYGACSTSSNDETSRPTGIRDGTLTDESITTSCLRN